MITKNLKEVVHLNFDVDKKNVLTKKDKSKKGKIDEDIRDLVHLINSSNDFFTTSSCSGRIILFAIPKNAKKHKVKWLFVSHKPIKYEDLIQPLELYASKVYLNTELWFKFEPFILHVCSRNLEKANLILNIARDVGFKHSGIVSLNKKIVVEINGIDYMSLIIGKDGKIFLSEDNLKIMIKKANNKLMRNMERVNLFKDSVINKIKNISS